MGRGDVGRTVEVVLVEDHPADDVPGSGSAAKASSRGGREPGADPVRRRVVRRRRRLAALLGTGALLVALGSAVLGDQRERRALDAYRDVPGLVASLRHPVAARWSVPATQTLWAAGDVVVATEGDGVVARDAATGEVRWSAPLPDGVVQPVQCPLEAGDPGGRTALVCFARGAAPSESRTVRDPGLSRIGAVDTADGTLLGGLAVPGLRGSTTVDGDLVLVELAGEGLVVSRHDVVRGERVWRTELPGVVPGPDGVLLHAAGDLVVVEARTTTVLAAADGSEVGRWASGSDPLALWTARVVVRPGEGYGVWTSRSSGRWYGPEGSPGPELVGQPADPAVHDASTPGVVLLTSPDDDTLRAVVASTGEQRWERPAPSRVLLRLGGRVVVAGEDRLEAWDASTGRTSWTVRLPHDDRPELGEVMTDGLRVLVPGRSGGGPVLTAYSLATGDRLWQVPVPGGGQSVAVLGDRLVVMGSVRTSGDGTPELTVLG
jgi:outer membrane protein assembly factor BamB